uniref:Uncharacterized protein n=1 Tax=Anguilla anguilla TaxID=7936 RepID=A0A0E9WXZ8_ANGAN
MSPIPTFKKIHLNDLFYTTEKKKQKPAYSRFVLILLICIYLSALEISLFFFFNEDELPLV